MKKVLWIVILAAALAAVGVAAQRWQVEAPNRTVELVYDLPGLEQVSAEAGLPLEQLLADLKAAGVETIAVQPESLGERMLAGGSVPDEVLAALPADLQELGSFLTLPLAFYEEQFQLVQAAGLQTAPKLNTVPWEVEPVWAAYHPELIILSGQGSVDLEELPVSDGVLALVEFSSPHVAASEASRVVRLHGISAREMRVLSDERILNRYVRAVRERNIRVLYVRPFMEEEGGWQRSLRLLKDLSTRLEAAGFELGTARPFASWQPSLLLTAVTAVGIWAAAVLYGQILWHGCAAGSGGRLPPAYRQLSSARISPLLAKQGLALAAAVVFPCLALEYQWGRKPFCLQSVFGVSLGRLVCRVRWAGQDSWSRWRVPRREAHARSAHRSGLLHSSTSHTGIP